MYAGQAVTYPSTHSGPPPLPSKNEVRQLEVESQMDSLEPNLAHLFDLTTRLESRLSESVLRSSPPSNEKGEAMPRAVPNTPLGARLQNANDSLISLACRLNSIMDRLEV